MKKIIDSDFNGNQHIIFKQLKDPSVWGQGGSPKNWIFKSLDIGNTFTFLFFFTFYKLLCVQYVKVKKWHQTSLYTPHHRSKLHPGRKRNSNLTAAEDIHTTNKAQWMRSCSRVQTLEKFGNMHYKVQVLRDYRSCINVETILGSCVSVGVNPAEKLVSTEMPRLVWCAVCRVGLAIWSWQKSQCPGSM